jgi:hypothetical protein
MYIGREMIERGKKRGRAVAKNLETEKFDIIVNRTDISAECG